MRNLITILLLPFVLFAKNELITNTANRAVISLNGDWHYIVDPYENGFYNYRYQAFENFENPGNGAYFTNAKPKSKSDLVEYDFDQSDVIRVPGDWNSQKEKLFYYEGTIWYKTAFDYRKTAEENRVFLYFGAVNYEADVFLNGKKLGKHIGGFTPFNFEITHLLNETDNFLIVKVDNKRKREGVPTLNTDWWNYGGITRDVKLIETPANFIRDYRIQLEPENPEKITGYVHLSGENIAEKTISVSIPEAGLAQEIVTDRSGYAELSMNAKNLEFWSPEHPKLYDVRLTFGADELRDSIGFRTITTSGTKILLNGAPVFLKGISIHEENPLRGGRAHSEADARQLLTWAKELGCNFVRLAHYPHNENMPRLADEMGLLVWEEIPVYWTILWENEATYHNASAQLTAMISRDKNRASVIIWSMANETPASNARNAFLTNLAKLARQLDPTRLISAALEQRNVDGKPNTRTIDDPFASVVDVLSFNQYIGWYDGLPDKARSIRWEITQNKPVLISEFGAGAKYGHHGDKLTRWTEEYQAYLYTETLKMIENIDQLQGFSPWILVDFRSPRRPLPGIQDGWNRKGLLSEKGEKKQAFYILQQFYQQR